MSIDREITTARLKLRPWDATDAAELLPILQANQKRFASWIPTRVSAPAELPLLEQRLSGFNAAFMDDREWRFNVLSRDDGRILGELDLFPRDENGRVALKHSDRAEVGYWLRSDATGHGFVIEGARALLTTAAKLGQFKHIEIRCNPRNAPSVAVAKRLGFMLAESIDTNPDEPLQVWTSPLSPFLRA